MNKGWPPLNNNSCHHFQSRSQVYIKKLRKYHALLPCLEGPYEELLTTRTSIIITDTPPTFK